MEMTRPGGTVATPNLKVDPSQALGNPHRTRVPTFPQRRRRLDSYQARSRTPLKSWAPSDSCTELPIHSVRPRMLAVLSSNSVAGFWVFLATDLAAWKRLSHHDPMVPFCLTDPFSAVFSGAGLRSVHRRA